MDCGTPGYPVLHYLLEFSPTHVYWVDDAIQLSHALSPPSPHTLHLSLHQSLFQWVGFLHQVAKVLELQHASVLAMNIQGWFPSGLTGLVSLLSKGLKSLLQHHSSKASVLQCSAFFMVHLSHRYMTTGKTVTIQTFVGKEMSLCWQSLSSHNYLKNRKKQNHRESDAEEDKRLQNSALHTKVTLPVGSLWGPQGLSWISSWEPHRGGQVSLTWQVRWLIELPPLWPSQHSQPGLEMLSWMLRPQFEAKSTILLPAELGGSECSWHGRGLPVQCVSTWRQTPQCSFSSQRLPHSWRRFSTPIVISLDCPTALWGPWALF